MTHFNPYSFPTHLVVDFTAIFWLYFTSRFFGYYYFHSLRHKRDLKFGCYTLLWLHCWFWTFYDITAILNAYYFNPNGPPNSMKLLSADASRRFQYLSNALFDVVIVTHTSLLFLLVSFWHTLFKADVASRFVKKWEFKAFFVYAIISVIVYPATQWPLLSHSNPVLIVVVPQFIYCAELVLSSILFLVVVYRMKKGTAGGELARIAPIADMLSKLTYILIFWDMMMAFTLFLIDLILVIHNGNVPDSQDTVTLGVWELLQCGFIITMLSVVITISLILNVTQLTKLMQGKGIGGKATTTHQSEAGSDNTHSSQSHNAV